MMPGILGSTAKIYIQDDASGEMMELGQTQKIELDEVQQEYETFDTKKIMNVSHEVSISYKPKKISKKRFIKLLMARKIQRNAANELVKVFLERRGYYSYLDLVLFDGGLL
jgi:hypothetical protein